MEIVNVLYNGTGQSVQNYSDRDLSLINSSYINTTFGDPNDYIEAFISDEVGTILNYDYNLQSYYKTSEVNSGTNKFTSILVDPQKDVADKGFNRGSVTIQYNVLKNLFNSKYGVFYWIKDISPSRLELKLSSQQLSGDTMRSGFSAYQNYISQKNYYSDFYLNFGDNNLILAVNAAYVSDDQGSYILIKLYEPLPSDFDLKSRLWIVDKLSESVSFNVNISIEAEQIDTTQRLRGPNFKVEVTQKIGQTTPYYSYNNLFSAQVSSSIRQLMSYYEDKAVAINTDYTDFNNFVHFSSATERINNFAYKVGLIENYNIQIVSQSRIIGNSQVGSIATASINVLQNNIDSIIEKFDNYEYYLYYTSGTYAWPKINSAKPYSLHSVTSSQAINWLGTTTTVPTSTKLSILYSASLYDQTNKDLLSVSIPQYLLDDPNNQPYVTFLDMIGQHFDNIWIYYKDVSSRFNATNDPNTGISLDLVSDALKGLGIELYTNTNLSDSAYYSLFGINNVPRNALPTGSTSSFPTGSEKNIKIVSSSLASLPFDQIQKEIYKRVYHNLPYLLKTRGTERGVKALIACYGIPDSILSVNEFGGTTLGGEDVFELNDTKINVITPTELSQSVLSPKSTLQTYDSNYRKNSLNVEVGFSPADILNANITSSLTYSIDQLIGNPALRYSSSYDTLDTYRNNYFSSSYDKPHSIAEYIRLIKFYNNSLFKMIKDFVPARSNISTGIIVKPHVLERNKYARNEPQVSIYNNYSESIDMVSISGSAATSYNCDTTNYRQITSSLGYIPSIETYGFEKYTGEYQGSEITVTNLNSIQDQREFSKMKNIPIGILYGVNNNQYSPYVTSSNSIIIDYESVNVGFPILFPGQGAAGAIAIFAPVYPTALQNLLDDPTTVAIKIFDESASANDGLTFKLKSTKYYGGGVSSFVIYVEPNTLISAASLVTTKFTIVALKKADPPYKVELGAIYQNVTESVRSQRRLDLDYTYNSRTPVNFGLVTKSLKDSAINNFATYTNRNNPYAELQDYNYNTQRSTIPRYYGSKTISKTYNTYTSASNAWQGDSSYGNTAAIDTNSYKVGWVKNIPAKSLNFPDKTTIYLKYLIDSSQNITDLSLQNTNLFEVQNTFKTGDFVTLSISDLNRPSNQTTLDGNKLIFKGGFSYDPIFYREKFTDNLRFTFSDSKYFKKIENAEGFYVQSNRLDNARSRAVIDWVSLSTPASSPTDPDGGPNKSMQYQTNEHVFRLDRQVLNVGGPGGFFGAVTTASGAPISDKSYSYAEWQAIYPAGSNNDDINFTIPTISPYSLLNGTLPYGVQSSYLKSYQRVFRIPLVLNDFDNGLSKLYEEPGVDVTNSGQFLYTAQYNGNYLINSIVGLSLFSFYDFSQLNVTSNANVNTIIFSKRTLPDIFKIFTILEKSSDGGSTWTKVASSRLDSVKSNGNPINFNANYNLISCQPNSDIDLRVSMKLVDSNLNTSGTRNSVISVSLNQGDVLRINAYVIDFSLFFKTSSTWYMFSGPLYNLGVDIAASNIDGFGDYNKVQIRNSTVPFFTYVTEAVIDKSIIPLINISGSYLSFSNKTLCDVYNSSSYFNPYAESSASQYYSEVVDTFNVQSGDLIRFGSFTSRDVIEYYTVLNVSSSISTVTDLGEKFVLEYDIYNSIVPGFLYNDSSYAAVSGIAGDKSSCFYIVNPNQSDIDYFTNLYNRGSGFKLDGMKTVSILYQNSPYTTTNGVDIEKNNKTYTFRNPANGRSPISIYNNYSISLYSTTNQGALNQQPPYASFMYIYVNEDVLQGTVDNYPQYIDVTELVKVPYISPNILLDRTISTASLNPNNSFAILRQKPNETSVIIDFRKKEGEVSQTILLPQDASDSIKSKVGDIFRNFNTDLQDNTTQNTA